MKKVTLIIAALVAIGSAPARAQGGTTSANIFPATTGQDLGKPLQRWDGFFQDIDVQGRLTCNGVPCAGTMAVPGPSATTLGGVKAFECDANYYPQKLNPDGTFDCVAVAANVASFNGRTGPVTLTASDISTALTYTPANLTNLQAHTGNMSNPHFVTAAQLGAGALSGNNTWSGNNYFKTLGSSFVFIDQMAGTTWTQKLEAADTAYATDASKIFIVPNDPTFDVDLIAHSFGHTIWHFLGNGFTIYQPTDNNFLQLSQDDEIGWLCTTSSGESCALWIDPVARGVTIPAIKSTTGTRYVCVDTTGKLVSSTTACSGT